MIRIDKLFKTFRENGKSQYILYTYYGISRAQIQRLKKNQSVTTHTRCDIEYFGGRFHFG